MPNELADKLKVTVMATARALGSKRTLREENDDYKAELEREDERDARTT